MSVTASCDALYFPDVPKDNIITLKYDSEGSSLQPNTLVVYKVKTSAPALFHVLPRYGALLVADPSGCSPEGFKGGSVAFALRENYAGGAPGGDDDGTPSRPSTMAGGGNSPGGGATRFQERFAVEYVVLHDESLAYQQVAHCLSEPTRLTEAAKNVWTLTTAGAIPKAHLGTRSTINLRAYLRNVVLNANDPSPVGDEAGKIVVPANATLVDPCMHDRIGSAARSPTSANAAGASRRGPGGSAGRGAKSATDELRALRDEVQQRRDSIHQNTTAASASPPRAAGSTGAVSRGAAAPATSAAAAAASGNVDQVMSLPLRGGPLKVQKSGKGVKLYLVVAIMCVVYILALWMRRGGAPAGDAHLTTRGKVGSTAGQRAPLGLPSNNNTVALNGRAAS